MSRLFQSEYIMDKWTEGELQENPKNKESTENKDILDIADSFARNLFQGNMGLPITYWV